MDKLNEYPFEVEIGVIGKWAATLNCVAELDQDGEVEQTFLVQEQSGMTSRVPMCRDSEYALIRAIWPDVLVALDTADARSDLRSKRIAIRAARNEDAQAAKFSGAAA